MVTKLNIKRRKKKWGIDTLNEYLYNSFKIYKGPLTNIVKICLPKKKINLLKEKREAIN